MSEISPKKEKLLGLLLTEKTINEACIKAGVNETTYWRWMKDESFLDEYRKLRRGILENTVSRLQSINFAAVETLERNLNCENPAAEIRAAQIILDLSVKGVETLDIEKRLELMEIEAREREKNQK